VEVWETGKRDNSRGSIMGTSVALDKKKTTQMKGGGTQSKGCGGRRASLKLKGDQKLPCGSGGSSLREGERENEEPAIEVMSLKCRVKGVRYGSGGA